MATLNPQTTYNDLIEVINQYMVAGTAPNEFETRRLRREAEKLKSVNPTEGWLISAMIASIRWERETLISSAQNAVATAPGSVDVLVSASQCLWSAGCHELAYKFLKRALTVAPNNKLALQSMVEQLMCRAHFTEAIAITESAKSMGVELDSDLPAYQIKQSKMLEIGITEERLQHEAALAVGLMSERRLRPISISITPWVDPDSGDLQFSFAYLFLGTVQQEIELENSLAEVLSQDEEWNPNLLSTEFEAVSSVQ